jgi:hypothetical protein
VADPIPPLHLGFLTVRREPGGYVGGYLVTNQWGRPLEFRLSTAVQPNRVQQILYAGTLESYLCADLIGKTLIDRTAVPVRLVVTDTEVVLDLRFRLEVPVAWIAPAQLEAPGEKKVTALPVRGMVHSHANFPTDVPHIATMLEELKGLLDLAEPFSRIGEAIGEARRMGVGRAA